MLKRSLDWLVLGIVPGCFGLGDWVQAWTGPALLVFWICIGFCGFSLLLSLFEDAAEPSSRPLPRRISRALHLFVRLRSAELSHRRT